MAGLSSEGCGREQRKWQRAFQVEEEAQAMAQGKREHKPTGENLELKVGVGPLAT